MKTYRDILNENMTRALKGIGFSKKEIKKSEADAKKLSKDSMAWVILQKGKLLVTANGNENGKIISKWVDGYKEV